ncbi:MAG TPA: DinB family protein [Thermoanaerobaculia bacterium]
MAIADSLLPEFDREMSVTRKLLDRVPEDKIAWKPHPKSYSLGDLAIHVANIPTWIRFIVNDDLFDTAAPFQRPAPFSTRSAALEFFDNNVLTARAALASASDARLMGPWSLKHGEQTLFTMPRVAVLRSFAMNHHIHHRGQLTVYLRMHDVPLPNMYGPTADER